MNDYTSTTEESSSMDPFGPTTRTTVTTTTEDDVASAEKTACVVMIVIFIVLILAGAGVWYYLSRRAKTPSQVETKTGTTTEITDTVKVKADTNLVSSEKGGTVTYADSNGAVVTLTIPDGALSEDTKIEIERIAYGRITDLYHLKPDGLKFLKPITVTIPYKESGLAEDETPYDIQLQYWFKDKYGVDLLGYTVDKDAKTLTAKVDEL